MPWWTQSQWRDPVVRQIQDVYEMYLKAGFEPKVALEKATDFVLELHRMEYE